MSRGKIAEERGCGSGDGCAEEHFVRLARTTRERWSAGRVSHAITHAHHDGPQRLLFLLLCSCKRRHVIMRICMDMRQLLHKHTPVISIDFY